ncbi:MAG: hypothetical protein JWQ03_618 [Variovorax sp.]|nr:hypothetical protein [Variovorax sp.]
MADALTARLCDECETVAHCSKYGCIPMHPADAPRQAANCSACTSLCEGQCPTPQACEVPAGELPRRPKTFRPDYGIEGPARRGRHFGAVTRNNWRLGRAIGAALAIAGAAYIAGAVGRLHNLF